MENTYAVEIMNTYKGQAEDEAVDLLSSDITIAFNNVSDATDVFGIDCSLPKVKGKARVVYVLATDLTEHSVKEVFETVVDKVVGITLIEF